MSTFFLFVVALLGLAQTWPASAWLCTPVQALGRCVSLIPVEEDFKGPASESVRYAYGAGTHAAARDKYPGFDY